MGVRGSAAIPRILPFPARWSRGRVSLGCSGGVYPKPLGCGFRVSGLGLKGQGLGFTRDAFSSGSELSFAWFQGVGLRVWSSVEFRWVLGLRI